MLRLVKYLLQLFLLIQIQKNFGQIFIRPHIGGILLNTDARVLNDAGRNPLAFIGLHGIGRCRVYLIFLQQLSADLQTALVFLHLVQNLRFLQQQPDILRAPCLHRLDLRNRLCKISFILISQTAVTLHADHIRLPQPILVPRALLVRLLPAHFHLQLLFPDIRRRNRRLILCLFHQQLRDQSGVLRLLLLRDLRADLFRKVQSLAHLAILQITPAEFQRLPPVVILLPVQQVILLQHRIHLGEQLHKSVVRADGQHRLRTLLGRRISPLLIIPLRQTHIGHIMPVAFGLQLAIDLCRFIALTGLPEHFRRVITHHVVLGITGIQRPHKISTALLLALSGVEITAADLHRGMRDCKSLRLL